jgi:hypothetical protein
MRFVKPRMWCARASGPTLGRQIGFVYLSPGRLYTNSTRPIPRINPIGESDSSIIRLACSKANRIRPIRESAPMTNRPPHRNILLSHPVCLSGRCIATNRCGVTPTGDLRYICTTGNRSYHGALAQWADPNLNCSITSVRACAVSTTRVALRRATSTGSPATSAFISCVTRANWEQPTSAPFSPTLPSISRRRLHTKPGPQRAVVPVS